MGLYDIYQDIRQGRGMFSPLTPFRSERKLARLIGPAAIRAYGSETAAGQRAGGLMGAAHIRGRAVTKAAGIGERGAMARQQLISNTGSIIQELTNRGLLAAERVRLKGKKLDIRGLMDRLEYGEAQTTDRQKRNIGAEEYGQTVQNLENRRRMDDLTDVFGYDDGQGVPSIESLTQPASPAVPGGMPSSIQRDLLEELYGEDILEDRTSYD